MDIVDLSSLLFSGETAIQCKAELSQARWKDGFICRACGNSKAYFLKNRALFECANKRCRKQTSATAGTQFHHARVIDKIWLAIKQKGNAINDLTSKLVKETMGVSYRASARALRLIKQSLLFSKKPPPDNQQKEERASTSVNASARPEVTSVMIIGEAKSHRHMISRKRSLRARSVKTRSSLMYLTRNLIRKSAFSKLQRSILILAQSYQLA